MVIREDRKSKDLFLTSTQQSHVYPGGRQHLRPHCGCKVPRRFRFYLLFEQTILSFLPAVSFISVAVIRIASLRRADTKTRDNPLRVAKLVASGYFIILQAAFLIYTTTSARTRASLAVAAVNVAAALQFFLLSWIEDARSVPPSTVACVYLLGTALLDLPQLRTLWLLEDGIKLATCFSAVMLTKLVMLTLE